MKYILTLLPTYLQEGLSAWPTACLSGITLPDFFRENGFMLHHRRTFNLHCADGKLQQVGCYAQLEELAESKRVTELWATVVVSKENYEQRDLPHSQ